VGRGYFVASEGIRVEHVESRSRCSNPRPGAPGLPAPLREEPGRRHLGIRGPEPASARSGDSGGCARGCADTRGVSVRMDATASWQRRPPNGSDGGRHLPSDRSPGPEVPPACGRPHPKTAPGRSTGRVRSGKVPDARLGLRRPRHDADAIHSLHGGASGGLPAGCEGCPAQREGTISSLMEPPGHTSSKAKISRWIADCEGRFQKRRSEEHQRGLSAQLVANRHQFSQNTPPRSPSSSMMRLTRLKEGGAEPVTNCDRIARTRVGPNPPCAGKDAAND